MQMQDEHTPDLIAVDGWEQTATGLRSTDGQHSVEGVVVGCDPVGERFLIGPPEGGDPVGYRIVPSDLTAQLAVALRTAKVEVEPKAFDRLASDLYDTAEAISRQAQQDFYGDLIGGRLFRLLEGESGGIGPRHPENVASVMRLGPQPRAMLLDDWLVAAELHWVAAEPAAGKTWLGLWLAWRVIREGGIVVWTDEELGVDTVAERLLALGADPDLIESNLVYLEYPGWQAERSDVNAWEALMKAARPSLVVIDTATDALAEAGVDENSGAEVTKWVKAYCEPPRRVGAAVMVLDHVTKADKGARSGYAVGSRAKKAKAKVQYSLTKKEDFTAEKTGLVRVTLDKNSFGLPIDVTRTYRIGGEVDDDDGEQRFVIEPASLTEAADVDGAFEDDPSVALTERLVAAVREHGPISATELRQRVGGNAARVKDALAVLVQDSAQPVEVAVKGRSKTYSWTGD
jgi:hypothetical protein